MENKNTIGNSFGSEQLAGKYNLFVTFAKKYLKGHLSYRAIDAANNAFEKAMLKLDSFRGTETQFESWIHTIVYNCCKDEQRGERRFFSHDGDVTQLMKGLHYEMKLNFHFEEYDKERLWSAFRKISEREQNLITYRTLYKWPLEDTAEALGIDKRYVSEYHKRALKHLKEKLGVRTF